jgi:exopolysaccharide biosynthesis polyprenyl glycosylphosphotransferase
MATQPIDPPIPVTDWAAERGAVDHHSGIGELTSSQLAWISFLELVGSDAAGRIVYVSVLKRCVDIFVSLLLLVVLCLPLLIVALAIKLESRGPVIFRQARIGRNGRHFVMFKFRTMMPDRRVATQPFADQERRHDHKTPNDPRVTRLGRFLRRTSIDELPQLLNVLRGEMSLVGPRPELPMIVSRYAPWQHQRHLVLPGMTGWWQIQGRSGLPMHEHTKLDIYYINHVSFWLDIYIMLYTIKVVLFRSGAF